MPKLIVLRLGTREKPGPLVPCLVSSLHCSQQSPFRGVTAQGRFRGAGLGPDPDCLTYRLGLIISSLKPQKTVAWSELRKWLVGYLAYRMWPVFGGCYYYYHDDQNAKIKMTHYPPICLFSPHETLWKTEGMSQYILNPPHLHKHRKYPDLCLWQVSGRTRGELNGMDHTYRISLFF